MDILGQPKLRITILEYYERSKEPTKVRRAVQFGRIEEKSDRGLLRTAVFGTKNVRFAQSINYGMVFLLTSTDFHE
jgi:hypothetical protein